MKKQFAIGTEVEWTWMGRAVRGRIRQVFARPVKRVLKGVEFKRNGSPECPAYLVRSAAGRDVLKLASELRKCVR